MGASFVPVERCSGIKISVNGRLSREAEGTEEQMLVLCGRRRQCPTMNVVGWPWW